MVTPSEAFAATADPLPPPPDLIRPTATARTIVGGLVALGLCFGLRDWLGAIIGGEVVAGFLTGALKLLGVVVGGLLAGAGRPRGVVTGLLVGAVLAVLFVGADAATRAELGLIDLAFGLTLTASAAVAGYFGGRVWPAPIELPDPDPILIRGSSLAKLANYDRAVRKGRPTAWAKILLGATLVAGGVLGADAFRDGLKQISGGLLNLGSAGNVPIVDLQLATMCILLGAAMTASSTGAGMRHGILVGLLAVGVLAVLTAVGVPGPEPVYEGFLRLIGLSTADPTTPSAVTTVLSAVFVLATFGGWLGGSLLPPLAPKWMRRGLAEMA